MYRYPMPALIQPFEALSVGRRLLIGLVAVLLLLGFWKGCNRYFAAPLEGKVFRIARDDNWYPVDMLGKERNMTGFTNDLLLSIARDQKLKFEIYGGASTQLFSNLDRGGYDAIIAVATPDAYTNQRYLFSDPIYPLGPVLVVRSSSPLSSIEDLAGKLVGFQRSSTNLSWLPNSRAIYTPFENAISGLDSLEKGQLDGMILDLFLAHIYSLGLYRGRIRVATGPLTREGVCLITLHKPLGEELITTFDSGLEALIENGTYAQLLEKWGMVNALEISKKSSEEAAQP